MKANSDSLFKGDGDFIRRKIEFIHMTYLFQIDKRM